MYVYYHQGDIYGIFNSSDHAERYAYNQGHGSPNVFHVVQVATPAPTPASNRPLSADAQFLALGQ